MKRIIKTFVISLIWLLFVNSLSFAQGVSYTIRNIEKINGVDYWTGFKQSHYGFIVPSTAFRGQEIAFSFPYKYIDRDSKVQDGVSTGTNTSLGYGAFAFDYSSHIVGLLYYINNNIPSIYDDKYLTNKIIEELGDDGEIKYRQLYMKEACKYVADEIVLNGYSKRYRDEAFTPFWIGSFRAEYQDLLLELENEYFLKAYGTNAIKYLSNFGINADLVIDIYINPL